MTLALRSLPALQREGRWSRQLEAGWYAHCQHYHLARDSAPAPAAAASSTTVHVLPGSMSANGRELPADSGE